MQGSEVASHWVPKPSPCWAQEWLVAVRDLAWNYRDFSSAVADSPCACKNTERTILNVQHLFSSQYYLPFAAEVKAVEAFCL